MIEFGGYLFNAAQVVALKLYPPVKGAGLPTIPEWRLLLVPVRGREVTEQFASEKEARVRLGVVRRRFEELQRVR